MAATYPIYSTANSIEAYLDSLNRWKGLTDLGVIMGVTKAKDRELITLKNYPHRKSGRIIGLPGVIMAFDTEYDLFGLDENNKVCSFNENGVENYWKFRQTVIKNGGHMTLRNTLTTLNI